MTDKQFQRTKLSNIMSYDAAAWLVKLRNTKLAALPEEWRTTIIDRYAVKHGRQQNSKMLEKVLLDVLKALGYMAVKPNDKAKKITTKGGKEIYIKSGGVQVGAADIQAIGHNRLINFEVKYRNDTQKSEQKEFEQSIKAAGFEYYILKSFDDFLNVMKIDTSAEIVLPAKKALDSFDWDAVETGAPLGLD
jgi:hypothetical protein